MLKLHLSHINALDRAVAAIETEVGLGLEPFRHVAKLLSTIPGLNAVSANVVVAEIGIDMSRFATLGLLLSWACMCPRNDESAGYLQVLFHRLRARRRAKKVIIDVAASMLTAAWRMLRDGTEWHDPGAAHFDRVDAQKTANRLIRGLKQIRYHVHATAA